METENLSKSEPPRFGQRRALCYNPFCNAVLRLFNPNFKMDFKNKTAQNRKQKRTIFDPQCPI